MRQWIIFNYQGRSYTVYLKAVKLYLDALTDFIYEQGRESFTTAEARERLVWLIDGRGRWG